MFVCRSCDVTDAILTDWFSCFSLSVSPKSAILGHVPGTGLYYDVDEYEEVRPMGEKTLTSEHSLNM